MFFRILWGIDIVVALIAVAFFVIGIGDGSVSSFNIVLWLGLLGGLAAVVFGTRTLRERGYADLAVALAAVPAIPAVGGALLLVLAIATGARWN